MSERSELRSRREELNLNGVKNLLGARPFPKPPPITDLEILPKKKTDDPALSSHYKVFKKRGK